MNFIQEQIDVSIPFSTIKSYFDWKTAVDVSRFQFHLVRLKVPSTSLTFATRMFQFHLVRLKVRRFCFFRFRS